MDKSSVSSQAVADESQRPARDSALTTDELYDRATKNCYIHAEEAFQTGLVAQILNVR